MLKKYIRKEEVLYVKWDGKKETLNLIKKEMVKKSTNKMKVGVCKTDKDILYLTEDNGFITSTSYIQIGDYVVLDVYKKSIYDKNKLYKLFGCNESFFDEQYRD